MNSNNTINNLAAQKNKRNNSKELQFLNNNNETNKSGLLIAQSMYLQQKYPSYTLQGRIK